MMRDAPLIITVDGPAASGKGTLTRALASHYGLYVLDTGAIYRLLAFQMQEADEDVDAPAVAEAAATRMLATFNVADLDNPALRSDVIGQLTSRASVHAGARAVLLDVQRRLAIHPPKPFKGTVLDGRDTGTVVCPDAPIKFFITADVAARAARRTKELQSRGFAITYETVYQDLEQRDARDSMRSAAPLKPATDAIVLDTTAMDADQVLATAKAAIAARMPALG